MYINIILIFPYLFDVYCNVFKSISFEFSVVCQVEISEGIAEQKSM